MAMQVSTNKVGLPLIKVRRYASPGIDGYVDSGVLSSGAGSLPDSETNKAAPYDWISINPNTGGNTGKLIGTCEQTKAPTADSMRGRIRGKSPFGGHFPSRNRVASMTNVGGSVDTCAGAGALIAGGSGAASSLVRVNGRGDNPGMKLPILPNKVERGGVQIFPSGGQSPGFGPAAPVVSKIRGLPTLVRVLNLKDKP